MDCQSLGRATRLAAVAVALEDALAELPPPLTTPTILPLPSLALGVIESLVLLAVPPAWLGQRSTWAICTDACDTPHVNAVTRR
jgi:hypothetical protein